MKRIKSRKVNAAIIAGALSASIVLGGVATALSFTAEDKTTRFVNALESNYNIQINNSVGKTYYVAPDVAEGEGDGSEANPFNIYSLLNDGGASMETVLAAGDTVLVKPGVYKLDKRIRIGRSAQYNKYITIKCTDETQETVIDFYAMTFDGNNRGVQIDGDFYYWYGVDIRGAGDNGMYIGGSYNVVENCQFYNNRDTGLQLGRSYSEYTNIEEWPSYNLIKNCTSFNNYDNETYGENADGFAAKLTVGYSNIFDGCIAYRNSDDGWDLFAKVDSGNIGAVILYNCVAFENGYIWETQKEYNARFPYYNDKFDEVNTNSYLTRDGDGNGFKLGGSVMKGDVYLYNCLSFYNRMHGVTDNSNPGVLSIKNVTSYNNSAGIDNEPTSSTFGQITLSSTGIAADGNSGNINLSRQTYSYNLMSGIVSVNKDITTVAPDEYRGSVEYSYMDMGSGKANKFTECVDASDRTEAYAQKGTSVNAITADIFEQLPSTWTQTGTEANKPVYAYEYNLSGKGNNTVHVTYRNADGSINMGSMLKIKDYSTLFGDSNKIGADLTKGTWAEYEHYGYYNASNASSAADAAVKSAVAALDLNTNINATFQDFDLIIGMEDVSIEWSSSDKNVIAIQPGDEVSPSGTKDSRAIVYRAAEDKQVTLTAKVTSKKDATVTLEKTFVITVKADVPTLGDAVIEGVEENLVIFDQFDNVKQPTMVVQNAADYNGKLLKESAYTVETTVMFTSDKEITPVQIHHFTPNVAGIYHITYTAKLGTQSKDFTYTIYVASPTANVNFSDTPSVSVYRDGYTISGAVNSATGKLYAYSSKTAVDDITAEQVIANGKVYEFRADNISFNFENDNSSAYYIYYVMCNIHGDVTSQVGTVEVKTKDITNISEFKDMMVNNNSATIYLLKSDLDLSGETNWAGDVTSKKKSFSGLLNGLGHTVSNFKVTAANDEEGALFYRLSGGTVENIKFENFEIVNGSKNKVGIFATTYGGYIYNVAMKNIKVTGAQRVGALVGQIMDGTVYIDQVSLVNDVAYVEATATEANFAEDIYYTKNGEVYTVAEEFAAGTQYYIRREDLTGTRVGGIVGDIQASSANGATQSYISNCYMDAYFGDVGNQFRGSIVGRYDDRNAKDVLSISNCYSISVLCGRTYVGGILGSQNTGAGVLRITNCLFNGKLFYTQKVTASTAAEKNCSGIVGRYAGTADAQVKNCYARFEDHNSNFEVNSDSIIFGEVSNLSFWNTNLGLSEERWSFFLKEGETTKLAEPYAMLKFLGNWN